MHSRGKYWVRLGKLTAVALSAGLVGGIVGSTLLTSAFYAHALTHPGCGEIGVTPADVGIEGAQDVAYLSHDGLPLQSWYLPPQNGAVIVLLPGLGGGRDGMLREGAILARHGYGLLLTETRSCAHPEGQTTLGYREAADLAEAVTWVLSQPGVAHVGALGYSLGGVTAVLGAARDDRIEAVVAEGGFYDLAGDVTNEGDDDSLWAAFIHRAVLFFLQREIGVTAREISPISVVAHISPRPLLLIYGEREVAEARPWEQLTQAGEPKEL